MAVAWRQAQVPSPPPVLGLPQQGLNSLREATRFSSNELQPSCTKLHTAASHCPDSLHPLCKQGMARGVHIFAQTISTVFLVLANKSSKRPPHPPSLQVMAALFPHDNFIILFEYIYMLLSHT